MSSVIRSLLVVGTLCAALQNSISTPIAGASIMASRTAKYATAPAAAAPYNDPRAEAALIKRLTHSAVLPSYFQYTVRAGDSVESIAQRFHDIAWLIRRRNGGRWSVAPGQRIRVLRWPFGTPYWATRTIRSDRPETYTVQAGDTLWSIAGKLQTDAQSLASQNALGDGTLIYAGQKLVLHHYTLHTRRVWIPGVTASQVSTGLLLTDYANLMGTDAALVKALAWHESSWTMETGASGEIGIMQIMPYMADWVQGTLIGYPLDPHLRENNILQGMLLLAYYLDVERHDMRRALARYHSGNTLLDARNRVYANAILQLRGFYYHHPRLGF